MKKLLLISTTALSLSAVAANANHLTAEYFYGGIDFVNTSLNVNGSVLGSALSEDENIAVGLNIGARYDIVDNVFIAPEVYYTFEDSEVTNSAGSSVDLEATYGIDAKVGYDFGGYNLYGIVGWTILDFDAASSLGRISEEEGAFRFGIGSSFDVSDVIALRTEYTRQDRVDVGAGSNSEIDLTVFKFGVSYKF